MTIKRYGTSSAECPSGIYVLYSEYERVVAECERLRAALTNPVAMKIKWSPMSENMVSSFSQPLGEDVLGRDAVRAKSVTVYYGETRTFKNMAEFCAAHPKEKA